ncbi:MAG: glutathione S-transferase N-terminal domain-containing protein [Myxococcales bacterium]|nr:glutathione S-transferase N-terminal domain-containing protein [Myxococcales bacterium]
MDLYFLPLACSMATRIALLEADRGANFIEVDPFTKTTPDGGDFHAINPLGLVPALRTDDGKLLTENVAVLLYLERLRGGSADDPELHKWLGFISTELHGRVFSPLFDRTAPAEVKQFAAGKAPRRLQYVDQHLEGRELLLDGFTVADAYLITVLNWAQATPVDLAPYPNLRAYLARGIERPSVKQSISIELPLYLAERRRATQ